MPSLIYHGSCLQQSLQIVVHGPNLDSWHTLYGLFKMIDKIIRLVANTLMRILHRSLNIWLFWKTQEYMMSVGLQFCMTISPGTVWGICFLGQHNFQHSCLLVTGLLYHLTILVLLFIGILEFNTSMTSSASLPWSAPHWFRCPLNDPVPSTLLIIIIEIIALQLYYYYIILYLPLNTHITFPPIQ